MVLGKPRFLVGLCFVFVFGFMFFLERKNQRTFRSGVIKLKS